MPIFVRIEIWICVDVAVRRDCIRGWAPGQEGVGVAEGFPVDVGKNDEFEVFGESSEGGTSVREYRPVLDGSSESFVRVPLSRSITFYR